MICEEVRGRELWWIKMTSDSDSTRRILRVAEQGRGGIGAGLIGVGTFSLLLAFFWSLPNSEPQFFRRSWLWDVAPWFILFGRFILAAAVAIFAAKIFTKVRLRRARKNQSTKTSN
jgi:hypothetical protein